MADGGRNVVAFTMAHNESVMLPLWVDHYVRQVGAGHIHLLDHGSDTPITDDRCHIVRVQRGPLDEIERTKIVTDYQHYLLDYYDDVMFVDCDEFLIADPLKFSSLNDYAAKRHAQTVRCIGADVIEPPGAAPVDFTRPILRQRPYAALRIWSFKTPLSSVPLTWQPGFHTSTPNGVLDRDLWMFHLKYADFRYALARLALTRSLDWSETAHRLHHGASHRVTDAMLNLFMRQKQSMISEFGLDALLTDENVDDTMDSDLRRIPDAFLDHL